MRLASYFDSMTSKCTYLNNFDVLNKVFFKIWKKELLYQNFVFTPTFIKGPF